MISRAGVIAAWADTRLAMRLEPPALQARQARLWRALAPTLARTPALAAFAGGPLDELPISEPGEIRRHFERWNSLGLSRDQAERAAAEAEAGGAGEVRPGVVAGWSTGTTGERGVFIASPDERARYLGQILAKLLPPSALVRGARLALVLRANSRLYSAVSEAGRFSFRWFGLTDSPAERAAALERFNPDILIAPSHVLADLAERAERGGWRPRVRRLFWGAEPMGAAERGWIAEALGSRPDPILQATEGFLGSPCRLGRLHLNEDALVMEREEEPETGGFRLIVTDLFRRSQPIVRVRMDDLLEEETCACGRHGLTVRLVSGRVQDVWRFGAAVLPPRAVIEAMEAALGPRARWRATASINGVQVQLEDPALRRPAENAIRRVLAHAGADTPVRLEQVERLQDAPKRLRVRWTDAG